MNGIGKAVVASATVLELLLSIILNAEVEELLCAWTIGEDAELFDTAMAEGFGPRPNSV